MKKIEIYGLFDGTELRYIGKAKDAAKRLKYHLRERRRTTPVYLWIESLRQQGRVPVMRVIMTCEECEWEAAERRLIAEGRAMGIDLLNVADGGNEPKPSPESNRANANKLNARLRANPTEKRIRDIKRFLGEAMKKGWVAERTKIKLRAAAAKSPHIWGCYATI